MNPWRVFTPLLKNSHFLSSSSSSSSSSSPGVIAIFLPCHLLMYRPLIHIKDEARWRIFSVTLPCHPQPVPIHSPPLSLFPLIYIKAVSPFILARERDEDSKSHLNTLQPAVNSSELVRMSHQILSKKINDVSARPCCCSATEIPLPCRVLGCKCVELLL